MKPQTLLALAITALGLAACGSGGSGSPLGDGSHNPNVSPNNPNNPNNPNPGGGTPQPPAGNDRTGKAISLSPDSYQKINNHAISFTENNFGVLRVDGREINILPPGVTAGGMVIRRGADAERVVNVMTQSSFGYVRDGANTRGYMFSQGVHTSANDMPARGVFNYEGYAAHASSGSNQVAQGLANFQVNFDNQSISGTITPDGQSAITLDNGTITGTSFSGVANSGARFDGNFYGGYAAELGGTYEKSGEYIGAFGATQINP